MLGWGDPLHLWCDECYLLWDWDLPACWMCPGIPRPRLRLRRAGNAAGIAWLTAWSWSSLALLSLFGGLSAFSGDPDNLFSWQYRAWIRRDYGRNPFQDQEELQRLLGQQHEGQKEQQLGSRDCSWLRSPATTFPPPCHAGGTGGSRWMNR